MLLECKSKSEHGIKKKRRQEADNRELNTIIEFVLKCNRKPFKHLNLDIDLIHIFKHILPSPENILLLGDRVGLLQHQ